MTDIDWDMLRELLEQASAKLEGIGTRPGLVRQGRPRETPREPVGGRPTDRR